LAHSEGGNSEENGRSRRFGPLARWSSFAATLGLVSGAAGVTACTELAPGSDILEQGIRMSLPDASASDPRWSCLDQPAPSSANPLVPTVQLVMAVTDTVTGGVPEGLSARACAKRDASCSITPLAAPVSPSADGQIHLTVPWSFDGFVEMTSPSSVSTMYFVNRPLMRDTARSLAIISTLALNGLAMQARIPLDPMLGHVLIYAFDCMGSPASDVELTNNAGGVPFIFVDGLPSLGTAVTSQQGIGGFVNVSPGFAVLQAHRVDGARLLGTTNVLVRPLWFSYSDVQPL
jgi:hypothetical protein